MKKSIKSSLPQKDRKHQAIINAAIKVFLTSGFASASMDEIAKQANVSKRTIYDHFANKENLFQTILKEHWNSVFEINESLFDNIIPTANALKHFAEIFLDFLYQPKTIDLFRLLISESTRFPHLVDGLLMDEKAPFTRELIQFLNGKKKTEELAIKNTERAAAYFLGLLKEYHFWPMMMGFTKAKTLKNSKQMIDEAVTIFIKAYTQ